MKILKEIFDLVCFLISIVMALAAMFVVAALPLILALGVIALLVETVKHVFHL